MTTTEEEDSQQVGGDTKDKGFHADHLKNQEILVVAPAPVNQVLDDASFNTNKTKHTCD